MIELAAIEAARTPVADVPSGGNIDFSTLSEILGVPAGRTAPTGAASPEVGDEQ